jgi:general secretion pathway protein I
MWTWKTLNMRTSTNIRAKQGHPQQGRAGFTLLEILVAMSIITFALIAIFRLYTQTISNNYLLSFNTTAPFLAQKIMAEQTSMPGDELGDNSGDFEEKFPGYTWAVTIEDLVPEVLETDDLKKIDVRVFLNGGEETYYLRRYRFLRD